VSLRVSCRVLVFRRQPFAALRLAAAIFALSRFLSASSCRLRESLFLVGVFNGGGGRGGGGRLGGGGDGGGRSAAEAAAAAAGAAVAVAVD